MPPKDDVPARVQMPKEDFPVVRRGYTWREVAAHNTPDSAWVILHGRVYDVTGFLDSHPGGREMLLLAAGRECTDLFASYHWFDDAKKATATLEKFYKGALEGEPEFPAYAPDAEGFYAEVSRRVRKYFADTAQDPKDPWPGLWRLAVMFLVAAACYAGVHGLLGALPFPARLALAAVGGVFQAMPLLHAMHDACHTALGGHEGWWKVVGRLCLEWYAGGSMITWHHQHVVGHHVYTNVFKADPDLPPSCVARRRHFCPCLLPSPPRALTHTAPPPSSPRRGRETGDLRRHVPQQAYAGVYRFQWLYLPVLYGLLGVLTRVQDVLETYLRRMSGPVRVNYYGPALLRLVAPKALWLAYRVLLPLLYLRVPAGTFWPCLAVWELATGFYLAWNFEVSHVADTVEWPVGQRGTLPRSWAASQVATGVDYAHGSWAAAWWSGALNYQIEHHLFPGVSQYHYPAIAGIVKAAAEDFKIPYRLEPSFWEAWKAHVRHLYELGKDGKKAE